MDPSLTLLVMRSKGMPAWSNLAPVLCFPLSVSSVPALSRVSRCSPGAHMSVFMMQSWVCREALFLCPCECSCDAIMAVQGGGMICGPGSTCWWSCCRGSCSGARAGSPAGAPAAPTTSRRRPLTG